LSAVSYLREHDRNNPKAEHYLVIGPWCHLCNISARKDPAVNGYTIDPVANLDTESLVFQWFDHVLRGGPRPPLLADRINYQVMGANTWSHSPSVEKMADRSQRLYLTSQAAGNRHALLPGKPRKNQSIVQTVDLADRKALNNLYPVSAYLDTPDDPAHIAYISEPFDRAVCICGLVTGEVNVIIDRKDFDFSWALYEATPEGKYINLSYYLGRASFAGHPQKRVLLTPGKPAALRFSNTPLVARQMAPGSRLLLLVTANKNPNAQVNYGTGKDVSDETIADADRPLKVQWSGASYIDVPLRDAVRN
jgi:predicted acyl esterase